MYTSTGFERFFLRSWEGWDELDTMALCFYNPKLTARTEAALEEKGIDPQQVTYVAIELNTCHIAFYGNGDEPLIEFNLILEMTNVRQA